MADEGFSSHRSEGEFQVSIEQLKDEASKLRKSIEARAKMLHEDNKRYTALISKISSEERKDNLEKLVGVEGGVYIGYCHTPRLRGKKATVLKVNRTRALVSIAGEEWTFPFHALKTDSNDAAVELMVNGCRETVDDSIENATA
jgi:hypothetical protein